MRRGVRQIRQVLQPPAPALLIGLPLTSCLRAAGGVREWRVYEIEGRSRAASIWSFAAYPRCSADLESGEGTGIVKRLLAITSVVHVVLIGACVSPVGIYRELRSDRHTPSASDLAGTWRVTPESAADAAATGLPLPDLQAGFISFHPGGTCSGDLYPWPCGQFPTNRRLPSEACRWAVSTHDKPVIMLTFGQGAQSYSFELHRLESDPPILWQYVCDPDAAEYLEFRRE